MRTKFKSRKRARTKAPKECEHPLDQRIWRHGEILKALACEKCDKVLRTIAKCNYCGREMIANGREGYGGICIFIECPRGCMPPILWNKSAYYGDLLKPLKPNEQEKEERKPVFAYVDLSEKPTHRWHYGRGEWVKLERG